MELLIKVRCQDTEKITRLEEIGWVLIPRAVHMVRERGMCTCGERETQENGKGDSLLTFECLSALQV